MLQCAYSTVPVSVNVCVCGMHRCGKMWAHISCVLWIPEVKVDCSEKMEPIINIAHIPVRTGPLSDKNSPGARASLG